MANSIAKLTKKRSLEIDELVLLGSASKKSKTDWQGYDLSLESRGDSDSDVDSERDSENESDNNSTSCASDVPYMHTFHPNVSPLSERADENLPSADSIFESSSLSATSSSSSSSSSTSSSGEEEDGEGIERDDSDSQSMRGD